MNLLNDFMYGVWNNRHDLSIVIFAWAIIMLEVSINKWRDKKHGN